MQGLDESTQKTKACNFYPAYPKEIFEHILKYCRARESEEKLGFMIDVACGSGQACNSMQTHFKKIVGIDISAEQIKKANKQNRHDNISYRIGSAENIPAADCSVDLITVGIAAHWFNLPNFFSEVERVLKPSGQVALFSHKIPKIGVASQENVELAQEASKILTEMLFQDLSDNSIEKISLNESQQQYPNIYKAIPFEVKERVEDVDAKVLCSIREVWGMIKTSYYYESIMEKKIQELKAFKQDVTQADIDAVDMAHVVTDKIKDLWNINDVSNDEKILSVDFQYFLLLARKP